MKRLIIITGASRGIGRAIATELNRFHNSDSHFLLLARDVEKLTQVRDQIERESSSRNTVKTVSVDFSTENSVERYFEILKDALGDIGDNLGEFDELIIVYNHGTLVFGNVSFVAQELREDFEVNLFSIWTFLAAINLLLPLNVVSKQVHVNISSGYATEASANWSGHCCGKFLIQTHSIFDKRIYRLLFFC